jgi:hypothetical protein
MESNDTPLVTLNNILVKQEHEQRDWLNDLEKKGRQIAKTNSRLEKFALMLSHPEFSEFFDANFNDWIECQQTIMLLKTGMYLRDTIRESTGEPISGNQLVAAMKAALDNTETRQFMIKSLYDFMKSTESNNQNKIIFPTPLAIQPLDDKKDIDKDCTN